MCINAWFVSNNSVKATSSNITAKSNAAFLEIGQTKDYNGGETLTSFTANEKSVYPATVVENNQTYKWQTGYAASKGAADINAAGLSNIDENKLSDYYLAETVYINAKEGSFTNLTGVSLAVTPTNTDAQITEAMRILLVNNANPNNWQVWAPAAAAYTSTTINGKDLYDTASSTGAVPYATMKEDKKNAYGNSSTLKFPETLTYSEYSALANEHVDGTLVAAKEGSYKVVGSNNLADEVGTVTDGKEVKIDMYVFYEGADHHIYTDNFANIKSANITVEFTATQVNEGAGA